MWLKNYLQSLAVLLLFLSIYSSVNVLFNITRPPWGDEEHFYITIQQFGTAFNLDTLRHYEEMSTPLPFILYAVWGHWVGFSLPNLRILSVIISILTLVLLHRLYHKVLNDPVPALLGTILFALIPYSITFSIFVFTDMLAILSLVICCLALENRNAFLFALFSGAALLCRQYLVFFPIAIIAYSSIRYFILHDKSHLKFILSACLSFIPLVLLFGLWRGFHPQNTVQAFYVDEVFRFHPNTLTLYLIQIPVYLAPVVWHRRRMFYSSRQMILLSLVASVWYFCFPITPSKASVEQDIFTVGIFHRFLRTIVGESFEHFVFYFLFLLSIPIAGWIIKDLVRQVQTRRMNFVTMLELAIILFFLVMPFSYLGWEKYFLPIIPLFILLLLMHQNHRSHESQWLSLFSPHSPFS